ncbi:Hydroxyacylglutathione hydrolase [Neobacillus rhizosphaerae]|uniref:Hydroxyacylglutathione hydrolase n=1 Tax=Neobacillus rhizosphaerae TaxID=2880965 RepID=A0ABN8KSQ6_9BACI|nr:MBL fold metallo-hydrolase [Neobacillus rhizosphaerae]CAH2715622.1 Hydroxyacylglutathione hydrolase [Neobacillus rhizosphaerae]
MIHLHMTEDVICVEGNVVRSGLKVGTVYSFLVDGMLIDTGPQSLEDDFISFYKNNSFDLVTLTHSHEDHSGNAPWIQANRNVPIYVHPEGIDICTQSSPYPKYRQITWGVRKEFQAMPLGDMIQSRRQEWTVIYTPGHAHDHVSLLHEDTGRLFSGDLFVSTKTKVIMESESIPVIMESIRTLLSYDFESMFCCHAGYIQNGKGMMKQKLDYLDNLYGEVKNLHKDGLTIAEINQKLFPKKYPIIAFSGGEWDSLHIIFSIISSIEKTHVN